MNFNGVDYRLKYRRSKRYCGTCDPPTVARPAITVDPDLPPERRLQTLLHEGLHACAFDWLDEAYVDRMAKALAALVIEDGWKRG